MAQATRWRPECSPIWVPKSCPSAARRTAATSMTVPGVRARVGLALDGDGDRVVMVDELGRCVDGDQLLYILATARHQAGDLRGPVVGTVMSNIGLEHALAERKIDFRRAQVGDRHVLAMLNDAGGTLGGET